MALQMKSPIFITIAALGAGLATGLLWGELVPSRDHDWAVKTIIACGLLPDKVAEKPIANTDFGPEAEISTVMVGNTDIELFDAALQVRAGPTWEEGDAIGGRIIEIGHRMAENAFRCGAAYGVLAR